MRENALSGAIAAVMIATIWVMQYLLTTAYGSNWFGLFSGDSLFSYVIGIEYGLGDSDDILEPLFIVVSRFILGFGFLWLPATLLIARFKKYSDNPKHKKAEYKNPV